MNKVKIFIDDLMDLPYYYYIISCIIIIILIDILSAFRFYYLNLYYSKVLNYADTERLKYLRDTVISGYKALASEEVIEKAIEKVREVESDLDEIPFDFSEYYEQYKKDLKNVLDRKYF